jgi:hypothetical protein
MSLGGIAQRIQHEAGLHSSQPAGGIELEDPIHVFAEVEDHRDVATLARQAGAGAAGQHGRAESAAHAHGRDDIVGVARNDQPDGDLSVVRRIGRVERAAPSIEANLTANHAP